MKRIGGTMIIAAVLSSCGMGWNNGGTEEFKGHCDQRVSRAYRDVDEITPDVDQTCDCLLEDAKAEFPAYEDYLHNKNDFYEAKIDVCLVKE